MTDKDEILESTIEEQVEPKKEKKKDKVAKLEEEVKDLKDQLLRNAAELENFKKRMMQEKINDRKYASTNLLHDLLVPLDQFDKVVNMETDNDLLKNFLIGFKMINDQFMSVLENEGVKEINALHQMFDPKVHHAVEKTSDKEKDNGIVLEVLQKGYMYKERVLRPSMVKVNEWSDENGEDK
ncbi:MAG: nucleotide exchange factor GrpE [Candidatus Phytoplasma sp.]|nr:nucleotide exchange factor GrpE [Phytoplasma sp.]